MVENIRGVLSKNAAKTVCKEMGPLCSRNVFDLAYYSLCNFYNYKNDN